MKLDEALFLRYLDGGCDLEERRLLRLALERDPAVAERFVRSCVLDARLRRALGPARAGRRPSRRTLLVAALVVTVLLLSPILGVLVWNRDAPRLEALGTVRVDGEAVATGRPLAVGTVIDLAEGASARIVWPGDALTIDLEGPANCRIRSLDDQPLLALEAGTLTATMTAGGHLHGLRVDTAYCQVEVLGTIVRVRVGHSLGEVAVEQGEVAVTTVDGARPQSVTAGRRLLLDASGTLDETSHLPTIVRVALSGEGIQQHLLHAAGVEARRDSGRDPFGGSAPMLVVESVAAAGAGGNEEWPWAALSCVFPRPYDWKDGGEIAVWFHGIGDGGEVAIEIGSGGDVQTGDVRRYRARFVDDRAGWSLVRLPFTVFQPWPDGTLAVAIDWDRVVMLNLVLERARVGSFRIGELQIR